MCFSPEADFAAAVVVGTLGVDALRHVSRPRERPLALLPVLLGTHQLVEVFVWLGLRGRVPETVWRPAAWLYLAIAFGVLPILVPVAVGALEPVSRRRLTAAATALGVIVAVLLFYAVVRGPIAVAIDGYHVAYRVDAWHGRILTALYIVVVCGPMLLSTHRYVRRFGAANLAAVCALVWLDRNAVVSVWCAWAAVASLAIALHLRHAARVPEPAPVG